MKRVLFHLPDALVPAWYVELMAPEQAYMYVVDARDGSLLFRHDLAPYTQFPDPAAADFGLDRIRALPAPAEVSAISGTGRFAVGLLLVVIAWRAIGHRRRGIAGPAV